MNELSHHGLQKAWRGAIILTLASIITKILSAAYRVPFQNIVGDVGFYIYQQVYPFYGVAIILSTYGFPVVISKLIVEHSGIDGRIAAQKICRISFFFLLGCGGVLFLFLYAGAGWIAHLMGDMQLDRLIRIVAFSFLILPVVSVWRGMFQAQGYMTPTAISQVCEQFIRVCAIILFSYFLIKYGYSLYDVGAGAILGSIAGGFAAVFALLFFYQRHRRLKTENGSSSVLSTRSIISVLILQGSTICISSLLLIFIQMVDAFTIYAWLTESGVPSQTAKQLKGIYDRGQPLIQLGIVVATAFSLSLVPFITMAKGNNLEKEIKEKISLSIRVSIAIGAGASVGLAWLIRPVNLMLFSNTNGSLVLLVLGMSILFCSIALTASAIMQGLGNPNLPAIYVILGVIVKFLLNYLLVPQFSTLGAAASTLIAVGVAALLLLIKIKRKTGISFLNSNYLSPMLGSLAAMSGVLYIFLLLTNPFIEGNRIFAALQSISGVFLGGAIFLWILLKSRYFSKKELSLLPLGTKLSKFIK